jgi:hypothetical protein
MLIQLKLCQMRRGEVRWRNIRGWMQIVSTPYDLFSWNKSDINLNIIDNLITFKYIEKGPLRMLTLCTQGPLRHVWLFFPSSSCSILPPSLLGIDCLSRFLSGGPGPPSPPSPELTPFPSGPRRRPSPPSGTKTLNTCRENRASRKTQLKNLKTIRGSSLDYALYEHDTSIQTQIWATVPVSRRSLQTPCVSLYKRTYCRRVFTVFPPFFSILSERKKWNSSYFTYR